ncbi:LysR family transcriptional regulator [Bradyrhizobium sp. USDA 223]|uniref:LysR family transcriptional regulator n=1 Tax=Bradyrhizobium sp. USDA 223 TaxID=3156306 RepID=UPI003835A182
MSEASWDLFRLFSVVARTGSVNRAAHELGMSQPTLSRRLKELERYVAAPLFFRASSGVKLTREGEDLQRSAGDMMLAFESFHRDLRSRVGQRSSVVRISATEGMTKHWLLPRVAELRRRDSRIYLEIISTVNQQSLATSDLDYVIRMGDPGENDLIGKRVADVPMGIFASEQYLAGRSAPRSLPELRDHDIIGHTADFVSFRSIRPNQRHLLEYFSEAAGTRSVVRVNPVANHFAAAGCGLGLALLAVLFAQAEGLVQVLPQETVTMNAWLLRRRESAAIEVARLEIRDAIGRRMLTAQRGLSANAASVLTQLCVSLISSLAVEARAGASRASLDNAADALPPSSPGAPNRRQI